MSRLLEKRSFWLALMLGVSGAFGVLACSHDPDGPGGGNCTALGGACQSTSQCCDPFQCQKSPHTGTFICDATVSCAGSGQRCSPSVSCCGNLECRQTSSGSSVCYDGSSCAPQGGACGNGITCCGTNICRQGVCAP